MATKKIMVLDVEGMSNCRPYDIGYIITDKKGNIYHENSMAILPCIWENLRNCLAAQEMTHKNVQEILNDLENASKRKYTYNSIEDAKKKLIADIAEWNIKEIWAYNCSFDKSALKRLFAEDFSTLNNLVVFYDIIPAILYTKLLNKKYVNFCNKNGFITEKGNVQVKAEIVYKYLFGDLTFEEEHTGLADAKIEYQILLEAIKTKRKLNTATTPAWKILRKFCEEKNIQIVNPIEKYIEEYYEDADENIIAA